MKKILIYFLMCFVLLGFVVAEDEQEWFALSQEFEEDFGTNEEEPEYIYVTGVSRNSRGMQAARRFAEQDLKMKVLDLITNSLIETNDDGFYAKYVRDIGMPEYEVLEYQYETAGKGMYKCCVYGRVSKDAIVERILQIESELRE